jgi:putative spermidine/putrescine transport system permease protein
MIRALLWLLVGAIVAIELAPLVVVVLVSVSSSPVFDVTVGELSGRWWERLWRNAAFWRSMDMSLRLAAATTALSLVLGGLAAVAIARARFPGREALATLILSPLMLPGIVVGIAMLQGYKAYGLTHPFAALVVAHVVVTLPFVLRTTLGALQLFDFTLIDAARTLGSSLPRALWTVLVPNLVPALTAGGLFAFLASFDNYPVSIFLADARTRTLPVQMLEFIEESPNPTIAAVSTLLLALAALALLAIDRLVGLRRATTL